MWVNMTVLVYGNSAQGLAIYSSTVIVKLKINKTRYCLKLFFKQVIHLMLAMKFVKKKKISES